MAAYITQQELQDRIGEDELINLSDRNNEGAADPAVIDRAIADATDEINMHLSSRYQMPLPAVPETIKRLAVNLTVYWLCESEAAMSDLIKERYSNAVKTLKSLASGTMRLGLPEATTPNENSTGNVHLVSSERIMTRNRLKGLL